MTQPSDTFTTRFPELALRLSFDLGSAEGDRQTGSDPLWLLSAVLADAARWATLTARATDLRKAGRIAHARALEADAELTYQGLPETVRW